MHPDPVDPRASALERARAGDEAGFLELYRTWQPRLHRYLRLREGTAADDLAGETWLHVVRDLHRFRGSADDFPRWLFTIARNRSVDAGRRGSRAPVVLTDDISSVAELPSRPVDDEALERMSTDRALGLLASLPPAQAEMVALRVLAGLDVATVARMVGRNPGAVRVAVHRALQALSRHPAAHAAREEAR